MLPSGAISFVSNVYEGSISDRKLVQESGLLEKLEKGDELMVDVRFDIQDSLATHGVRLNIPPFLSGTSQLSGPDIVKTKKITQLRVHVKRAMGGVETFNILHNVREASTLEIINEVIFVCCMLSNTGPPLVC